MAVPATDAETALIGRMDRAMADARANGREPSEYFLEKCDAEAGRAVKSEGAEPPAAVAARSPWALLFGKSWLGRLIRGWNR